MRFGAYLNRDQAASAASSSSQIASGQGSILSTQINILNVIFFDGDIASQQTMIVTSCVQAHGSSLMNRGRNILRA